MTQQLERAISELRNLSDPAQDAIAAMIFEQIADDRAWDEAFTRSQCQLGRLAHKARTDVTAGKVRRLSSRTP
jgi:hypothetical protein